MGRSIDTEVGPVSAADFEPERLTHRVFFGPKFLFAFFNKNDVLHDASRAMVEFVRSGDLPYRRFIVNEHALDEAATRLKKRASLRYAELLFRAVEESDLFRFERVPETAFEQARSGFIEWDDSDASFTDFVVAYHMAETGVDHIATYDSHYPGCHRTVGMAFGYRLRSLLSPLQNAGDISYFSGTVFGVLLRRAKSSMTP